MTSLSTLRINRVNSCLWINRFMCHCYLLEFACVQIKWPKSRSLRTAVPTLRSQIKSSIRRQYIKLKFYLKEIILQLFPKLTFNYASVKCEASWIISLWWNYVIVDHLGIGGLATVCENVPETLLLWFYFFICTIFTPHIFNSWHSTLYFLILFSFCWCVAFIS